MSDNNGIRNSLGHCILILYLPGADAGCQQAGSFRGAWLALPHSRLHHKIPTAYRVWRTTPFYTLAGTFKAAGGCRAGPAEESYDSLDTCAGTFKAAGGCRAGPAEESYDSLDTCAGTFKAAGGCRAGPAAGILGVQG